ncbi:hypothetical protein PAAG_03806 [Paracoccidioides lutzii Pb01]|uniref:Uncharacterized protein n=1 Tax=Paracoccidioides lutzii (strain ATCC MYA-826 / Pb01) TaxID=502779 RepID=C1GZ62_PARBA|nr:hypothetical protein PAAG_03806 [Paracoccidioides lutzii Pb01]EEH41885.2 hypothetical protein PAAG_03806 [Paracoccidioides lutzii Pb01]
MFASQLPSVELRSNAQRRRQRQRQRQRPALVDAVFQSPYFKMSTLPGLLHADSLEKPAPRPRRELPALASAITKLILCADVAVVALSTSRSTHARLAATRPLRPGSTTGARRRSDEEPPVLDACDISKLLTADSRMDSKLALQRALGGLRSIKLRVVEGRASNNIPA